MLGWRFLKVVKEMNALGTLDWNWKQRSNHRKIVFVHKYENAARRCTLRFFVAAAFFRRHFQICIEEVSLENAKNSDTWKNHLAHTALCGINAHEVSLKNAKNSDTLKNHLAHTVLCGLIEAIHSLIQFDFLFSPVQPVVLQDGQSWRPYSETCQSAPPESVLPDVALCKLKMADSSATLRRLETARKIVNPAGPVT